MTRTHLDISSNIPTEPAPSFLSQGEYWWMRDSKVVPAYSAPMGFKRDNETQQTYRLKWSAWEWLFTVAGCRSIGMEVRLEGPSGRVVDLVGVGPRNIVYVVEVKANRADFSRDNHTKEDLEALRAEGRVVADRVQFASDTLAQTAAYAQSVRPNSWRQVSAYRQALEDVRRLTRREKAYKTRLATYSIKFHDDQFLGIADFHYIIAPRRTISRRWVPPWWGLLDDTPEVVVAAPEKSIRKNTGIMSNVLRAIARSNTTSMMKAQGVLFSEDGAVFPQLGTDEGKPDVCPHCYQPESEGMNGQRYHRHEKVSTSVIGPAK